MHTRSAKNKITGKMTVTVIDWNGVECFRGEFSNLHEAVAAAAREERAMTLRMQQSVAPKSLDEILMSDDDLLAELGFGAAA